LSHGALRIGFEIVSERILQLEPRTSVFNRFVQITNRFPIFAQYRRSLLYKSAAGSATRAQDVLARFRVDYRRHAGDDYLVELIERLNSVSREFA